MNLTKLKELRKKYGKDIPLAYIMLGIVLLTVHLDWISKWGFGIIVGWTLLVAGSVIVLLKQYKSVRLNLPTLIPLFIIVLLAIVSTIQGKTDWISSSLLIVSLVFFLVGRLVGLKVFWLVPLLCLQIAVAATIEGLRWIHTTDQYVPGGMGLTGNSDLAGAILGFGCLLLPRKWLWLAIPIEVGMFFVGDHWSIIALVVVAIIMAVKRDYYFEGWKLPTAIITLGLVLSLGFWTAGLTQTIWGFDFKDGHFVSHVSDSTIGSQVTWNLNDRVSMDQNAITNMSLLGNGIQSGNTTRYGGMIHNALLMILDDLGPIAALTWLFLVIYLIVRYPAFRYIWVFVLVNSIFSYYWWIPEALGPWFFFLVGSTLSSRLIKESV